MHRQRTRSQPQSQPARAPRSSGSVAAALLLSLLDGSVVIALLLGGLVCVAVRFTSTAIASLAGAGESVAALAGLLVDVDVALLAVVPARGPGVGGLLRLGLVGLLLLLSLLVGGVVAVVLVGVAFLAIHEGVEDLFCEAGHGC